MIKRFKKIESSIAEVFKRLSLDIFIHSMSELHEALAASM